MNKNDICVMRVVEGSLTTLDPILAFPHKTLTDFEFEDKNWKSLIEVEIPFNKLHDIQLKMTKHYYDNQVPWYMDGWLKSDKNTVICAFGADDGENGKIFVFNRGDQEEFKKVFEYAISKGIPKDQTNLLEV